MDGQKPITPVVRTTSFPAQNSAAIKRNPQSFSDESKQSLQDAVRISGQSSEDRPQTYARSGSVVQSPVESSVAPAATEISNSSTPSESPAVKGIALDDKAYFDGFTLSFGKDGELGAELVDSSGRKIQANGQIQENGQFQLTLIDPKGPFNNLTYSGKYTQKNDENHEAEISEVKFLGRASPVQASS